jgi:hypothetical protein
MPIYTFKLCLGVWREVGDEILGRKKEGISEKNRNL